MPHSDIFNWHADHVGSFLRPLALKKARTDFSSGKISQAELTAVEDDLIRQLVQKQKQIGLHGITDGEFRRSWWHFDFMKDLFGAEEYETDAGYSFHGVESRARNIRITGKIAFNPQHPFLQHFKFLKNEVGDSPAFVAKQTIPSPNMFLHHNIRDNPYYDDLDSFCHDLGVAYKDAIRAFYQAGCRYLQIDDVFWAYLADKNAMEKEQQQGVDPEHLIELSTRTLNQALSDRPADLCVSMHVCRGNFVSTWIYQGGYDRIAEALGQVNVDALFLEYDDERSGSLAPLKHIRDQHVVLGLITSKNGVLEDSQHIIDRIQQAAEYLPLSKLALSPQCGFSSTEEGNHLTEAEQWAKLQHVIGIAGKVWKE